MVQAFAILLVCELAGEAVRLLAGISVPGPVIGMLLLALLLVFRRDDAGDVKVPADLDRTAGSLIAIMGLLFVPAGVGVLTETAVLKAQWLPIVAGLVGSTLLGLIVTGLVLHHSLPDKRPIDVGKAGDVPR